MHGEECGGSDNYRADGGTESNINLFGEVAWRGLAYLEGVGAMVGVFAMNNGLDPIQDRVTAVDVESTRVVESEGDRLLETTPVVAESHSETIRTEEFKISGDDLVSRVKQLIHQGNIRHILIKNEKGRTLVEVPLTVGVVGGVIGAALFPIMAVLSAIGAAVARLTLVVERKE